MRSDWLLASLVLVLVLSFAEVRAADWAQFRGPGGNAASQETDLPTKWSSKENVAWRTQLPGLGTSSLRLAILWT